MNKNLLEISNEDFRFIDYSIKIAQETESDGNLPIGAVIVLDGQIIAEGRNSLFSPILDFSGHAELNAIKAVDQKKILEHAQEMTLYTNIEPCIMCFGAIVVHRIGRVIYGGADPNKGATYLLNRLNKIYTKEQLPIFIGPILQEKCLPIWERANKLYRNIRR